MSVVSRRSVLSGLAMLGVTAADLPRLFASGVMPEQAAAADPLAWPPPVNGIGPAFPSHDPWLAKEVVGASHGNLDRVRELQPWSHGDLLVLLEGGTELRLSRRYRDRIQGIFGG